MFVLSHFSLMYSKLNSVHVMYIITNRLRSILINWNLNMEISTLDGNKILDSPCIFLPFFFFFNILLYWQIWSNNGFSK